jgi:hypothetical protein
MKLLLLSYSPLIEESLRSEALITKGIIYILYIIISPHGIPVDLLDRTLIIATNSYSEEELA